MVLDKTWQEIFDACNNGLLPVIINVDNEFLEASVLFITSIYQDAESEEYIVETGDSANTQYVTATPNGYPTRSFSPG